MTWLDSGIRALLLVQGTAARWLREELDTLKVHIRLTDGCIEELAREADQAARRAGVAGEGGSYAELLREHIIGQAKRVRQWTATDEKVPGEDAAVEVFVRIARKYALPRPWKLSDPVAVAVERPQPSWTWAAGLRTQAAGH